LTEHSFYHLQRQPLEAALPQLLERIQGAGLRAVVRTGSNERVQHLNKLLWTYQPGSFLPHGARADGNPDAHPFYLTCEDENPNNAKVLVLVDGADPADVGGYDRCLILFDGNDPEALEAARARWKRCRDGAEPAAYWQQSADGRWQEKAASDEPARN
jgi:DNA polymerase-3 subunit chi